MGLAAVFIIAAITAYLISAILKYLKLRSVIDKIPGPLAHFLLGNITQFQFDADAWQEQGEGCAILWSSPRMFRLWVCTFPYVVINGAEEAEPILSSNAHINKSGEYDHLRPWLGMGLLTNVGEKWRPRRKLLTPTFHYDILKDFMLVFNKQAKILVQKLVQQYDKGGSMDAYPYITLCALDIICETAMGQDVNAQKNKDSTYVKAIYKINEIVHDRQKRPWLWPNLLFRFIGRGKEHDECLKVIHGFTESVIKQRYAQLKNNGQKHVEKENSTERKRLAFLDLLINISAKEKWSFVDVRDEVNTFMFEGHDTTSASMNWTLHLLGCYPQIQEKIHSELDSIFGDDDREIHFDDLKDLNYLECCIKESLRLFPSVPMFARVTDGDVVIAGKTIPSGTSIMINPCGVHKDAKHWPDPEKYIPERFLPENIAGRHPYAYLPFSAGSRNCIGQRFALMEEKTLLAYIFRYFKIRSIHRRDQIRAKPELILRPDRGVQIELQLRRRPNFENTAVC